MSSPKNIQRDGSFFKPGTDYRVNYGTSTVITADPAIATTGASIYYDYGHVAGNFKQNLTMVKGEYVAVGLYMQQPVGDRHPYRVKARINSPGGSGGSGALIIGYSASDSPTPGADQPIEQAIMIPFSFGYDDLLIIEENKSLPNRPLIFAVAYGTGTNETANVASHLSVQNLGVKPPTMQNAVS